MQVASGWRGRAMARVSRNLAVVYPLGNDPQQALRYAVTSTMNLLSTRHARTGYRRLASSMKTPHGTHDHRSPVSHAASSMNRTDGRFIGVQARFLDEQRSRSTRRTDHGGYFCLLDGSRPSVRTPSLFSPAGIFAATPVRHEKKKTPVRSRLRWRLIMRYEYAS